MVAIATPARRPAEAIGARCNASPHGVTDASTRTSGRASCHQGGISMTGLVRSLVLAAAVTGALAVAGVAAAAGGRTIYTLSNSPSGNAVLAFSHPSSGVLSRAGS